MTDLFKDMTSKAFGRSLAVLCLDRSSQTASICLCVTLSWCAVASDRSVMNNDAHVGLIQTFTSLRITKRSGMSSQVTGC